MHITVMYHFHNISVSIVENTHLFLNLIFFDDITFRKTAISVFSLKRTSYSGTADDARHGFGCCWGNV